MKSSLVGMLLSLTVIAALMGALLGTARVITAPYTAQAETKAKNEALAAVLPQFDNDPSASPSLITIDGDKRPVTVYTATLAGKPAGKAVESWTDDGFSGEIVVMVGFDPEGKVSGYRVLRHAETPGLGAKAEEWFRDPTDHRSVLGTTDALSVSKDGGEIDGITAATITSRAFLDAINRARRAINR